MHRNRKDGRSNSHVSYTTRYMDLAGWNKHNVEQSSEFEQKNHPRIPQTVPKLVIISAIAFEDVS